jgi:hypothetical protein
MRKSLLVKVSQFVHRSVGVSRRLEIGDEMIAIVAAFELPNPLVDLFPDILPRQTPTWAETAVVAEGTAAHGHGSIDIRTGKTGVDTDPLDPHPVLPFQVKAVLVIPEIRGTPVIFR